MTKTKAFAKSVIIGTVFGAVLWAVIFLIQPSQLPIFFWLGTAWFWEGVTRGALCGWALGIIVGASIVSGMIIKNRLSRMKQESR